jgi:hypothetical protein
MFSLVHKKTSSINNTQNRKTSMIFEFKHPTQIIRAPFHPHLPPLSSSPRLLTDIEAPKMKWGKPIWTFFHVTAQKMKSEYFTAIIKDYFNYIVLICSVLPCPVCSDHASQYMRSININNIKTKDDLINMFFTFHNVVNIRKGYPTLSKVNIPDYSEMNTVSSMKNFMVAFEDKSRSMKLMADDLARMRIVEKLKNWINSNIQYFDP